MFLLFLLSALIDAGIADKKDLGSEYRDHVLKYVPLMRNPLYRLENAANYLENWVKGSQPLHRLLDVSGFLGNGRTFQACVEF